MGGARLVTQGHPSIACCARSMTVPKSNEPVQFRERTFR